jgi:hypothetical protein
MTSWTRQEKEMIASWERDESFKGTDIKFHHLDDQRNRTRSSPNKRIFSKTGRNNVKEKIRT